MTFVHHILHHECDAEEIVSTVIHVEHLIHTVAHLAHLLF